MANFKMDTIVVVSCTIIVSAFTVILVHVLCIVKCQGSMHDAVTLKTSCVPQNQDCLTACPGMMNCSEWSDCIYHQPDVCQELELRCNDEDETVYGAEVLVSTGDSSICFLVLVFTIIMITTGAMIAGVTRYYLFTPSRIQSIRQGLHNYTEQHLLHM